MNRLFIAAAVVLSMGVASQASAGCFRPARRIVKVVKNRKIRPVKLVLRVVNRVRPGIVIGK